MVWPPPFPYPAPQGGGGSAGRNTERYAQLYVCMVTEFASLTTTLAAKRLAVIKPHHEQQAARSVCKMRKAGLTVQPSALQPCEHMPQASGSIPHKISLLPVIPRILGRAIVQRARYCFKLCKGQMRKFRLAAVILLKCHCYAPQSLPPCALSSQPRQPLVCRPLL